MPHTPLTPITVSEQLRAVLRDFEKLDNRPEYFSFVGGSLVEGLGNRCSDFDVYVIGDAAPRGSNRRSFSSFVSVAHLYEHRRVHYEYWSDPDVARLASDLRALDSLDQPMFALAECDLIHRMGSGVPLTNPERFLEVRDSFEFEAFARYLTARAISTAENAIEDVLGMYDSDDVVSAVFRARELAGIAADVFRHHAGTTNPKVKWRARTLEQLPPSAMRDDVLNTYWRLEFPAGVARQRDQTRQYVRECVDFANRAIEWAQT